VSENTGSTESTPTGDAATGESGAEGQALQSAASSNGGSSEFGAQASEAAMKPTLGSAKGEAPAQKPAAPKAPTAAERRKYALKVDGQEIEEELTDDEIRVRLQKAHAVDKRFQEVASQRKQIEEALKTLKTDPAKALKEIAGLDLDEWAEKRIMERYQESMMPEAEREKVELQRKLAEYERQFEEQKTAAETSKREAYEQQVFEQTEQEFLQAIEQMGFEDKGFSRTVVLPMMAEIAEAALDYGVELTPAQMAAEANKRLETIHRRQVQGLKGDALLKYLGEDVVNEAIRAKLAGVRGATTKAPTPPPPARKPDVPGVRNKPMTPAEWRMKHLYGIE